jgi:hypothetical protein
MSAVKPFYYVAATLALLIAPGTPSDARSGGTPLPYMLKPASKVCSTVKLTDCHYFPITVEVTVIKMVGNNYFIKPLIKNNETARGWVSSDSVREPNDGDWQVIDEDKRQGLWLQ